jgi:hypothetical protein
MGGWAVKGKRLVPKTKHRDCLKKARGCLDRASVVVQNDEAGPSRLRFADSQAPSLRSIQTFKRVSEGVYSEVRMQQDPA